MKPQHRHLTKQQVVSTGIPIFVPREIQVDGEWRLSGHWNMDRPLGDILLSYRRCKELNAEVSDDEYPAGYIYNSKIKDQFRYVPLFARSEAQLDQTELTEKERISIRVRRTYAGFNFREMVDSALKPLVNKGTKLERIKLVTSPNDLISSEKEMRTDCGMLRVEPDNFVPKGVAYLIEDPDGKTRAFAWVMKRKEVGV